MKMKRHVVSVVETNHQLGRSRRGSTVGGLVDEMIGQHIAHEESLTRIVLDFDADEWDAIATPENELSAFERATISSHISRSACDDNDE